MYATYLIKIKDHNRAIECCREAIVLDKRHKIALLLYGILLWTEGENREAEIFLKSVTSLYPRFTEGWMILHLFYIRTEYYPGVDLTIQVAEKCLNDKDRDTVNVKYLTLEPLAWSMIHCPKDQIYIITAVLLLKMNLYDFAGIALAQELAISGRSTPFLYYMAVHHYLLGRYDDALSHLKEAQCQHGMDYSIGSLMGHCHYKEGNLEDAMYSYEFVNMIFDSPDDMHLVHLRMGQYCLDTEQNTDAIKYFLNSSKFLPTPQSWLGAGVTYYYSTQFEKSEMALMEANKLDSRNCDIWGYLCLLNMSLQRHDEFQQCYRQAVKNNLKNVKLWLMITRSMEVLGYSAPMLAATSKINSVEEFSKSGADANESVGVIGNEDDKDNET
ncbi:cilia- and flagella-associated protein 70 [Cephus cinctus]|uniref:Cilia- and flagella-associated protein 70 n=1 Tax=Cephus cinctus TaxID=211228 RepID=A0AAJ7RAB4_CEPCN|nr:cilia- and flagella-associated protein 70 [Cephus cinctus]